MARQLLAAGVSVKLAKGNLAFASVPGCRQAKSSGQLEWRFTRSLALHVFAGSTNWTVSSRANQECSVHLTLDEITANKVSDLFDAVWNNAEVVTTAFLMDQMNERLRVQAAKKLNNG